MNVKKTITSSLVTVFLLSSTYTNIHANTLFLTQTPNPIEDISSRNSMKTNSTIDQAVTDVNMNIAANPADFYNYSLGSYTTISLSGSFTLNEGILINGQEIEIADTSVLASIPGLEVTLENYVLTNIYDSSGRKVGLLKLNGDKLTFTIDDNYELYPNSQSFAFSNSTALLARVTQAIVIANTKVTETITVGNGSATINFHEQQSYDITNLQYNDTNIVLGSGASGYTTMRLYDIAFNQAGLNELQVSQGVSATESNLQKGNQFVASTIRGDVIPTHGDALLSTYVASESSNKIQTSFSSGISHNVASVFKEKQLYNEIPSLADNLTLEQMKAYVDPSQNVAYKSKQANDKWLVLQNITEETMTATEEHLRNTIASPLNFADPAGNATVSYYGGVLNNRVTFANPHISFQYIDPANPTTVITELLDPETGLVVDTKTGISNPQENLHKGQSTVKTHFIDDQGNPLGTVLTDYGWPTADSDHDGVQHTSEAKEIPGYTLNTNIKSIPGINVTPLDVIADVTRKTIDFPEDGATVNVYFVYSKNDIVQQQKAVIKYIDATTSATLKTDTIEGNNGAVIDYKTADKIETYEAEGYALLSNNFKDGEEKFDSDVDKIQEFEVQLTKDTVQGEGVTARYLDEEGNSISPDVVLTGYIGESFETEQKEIEGYTFKEVQGNPIGTFSDVAQTVTYIYTRDTQSVTPDLEGNDTNHTNSDQNGAVNIPTGSPQGSDTNNSTNSYSMLPQTGDDNSSLTMLAGTLLVLGASILAIGFKRKKSFNKHR